jgi:DNA polymerase III subunit gamma/tau
MSYLVLARKYRPKTIAEVAGQEVAMGVLAGALRDDRVGHAYLFCGPRGTGKTTTARILAKALNCERRTGPDPCGQCDRCLSIDAGSDVDVIEIDAASNRGVDDVRELRERVAYAPMHGRYKVYIVDEVHMLTKEANNALLKTLEEPPPHVKFFFATTEPHKLLDTVRSRCQIVQLTLIREEEIARHLTRILALEGVRAEDGVVEELARRARGSMRDALSLTDQLLALVGVEPTLEDVRRIAGSSGAEFVDRLLSAVEAPDRPRVLELISGSQGGELELVDAMLEHLRGALVATLCPRESALFESEPAERERRAARAARLGLERLQIWLEELLAARERMGALGSHARILLEVSLLDLCRSETSLPLEELQRRLLELEARLGPPAPAAAAPRPPAPATRPPAPAPSKPPPSETSASRTQAAAAPARGASAVPSGASGPDAFTSSVADLFTGQIEEPQA